MEYCTICMKKVVDKKNDLCKNCNKKRGAAKIVLDLTNKVDFKDKFDKKVLIRLGIKDKLRLNHYIWSLEECNLIHREKNYYLWDDEEKIIYFVEKYGDKNKVPIKEHLKFQKTNIKTCERCGKEIKIPTKKSKYCKKCKKINKTLKNISKIEKIIQFDTPFTIDQVVEETSEDYWKIEGIIWDLQENDLVEMNKNGEYFLIGDKIEEFKDTDSKTSEKNKNSIKTKEEKIDNSIEKEEKTDIAPENKEKIEESIENQNKIENKPISRFERYSQKIKSKKLNDKENDEKQENTTKSEVEDNHDAIKSETKKQLKKIIKLDTDENIEYSIEIIDEYIKDTITLLNRNSVEKTDVSSNEIFNNFNSYIKEKYNQEVSDEEQFINLFTKELFKLCPFAYRGFIKNDEGQEIIRFNIKLKFNQEKEDEITKKEKSTKLNPRTIIEQYIKKYYVVIMDGAQNEYNTFDEIYENYLYYNAQNENIIKKGDFLIILTYLKDEYGIIESTYLSKKTFNLKLKEEYKIDNKISDSTHKNKERDSDYEQSTIKNEESTTTKEIPLKIFVATYDEKYIIFAKSKINTNKFNNLLKLLEKTSKNIINTNIKRFEGDSLDISIEYEAHDDEKDELIETIQKYGWD